MSKTNKAERLERIKKEIIQIRGITELSRQASVSRQWIYDVLNGDGTSERILTEAERLISEHQEKELQKSIN